MKQRALITVCNLYSVLSLSMGRMNIFLPRNSSFVILCCPLNVLYAITQVELWRNLTIMEIFKCMSLLASLWHVFKLDLLISLTGSVVNDNGMLYCDRA